MEKRDTRPFQIAKDQNNDSWNIVELESHRELRRKTNEIIQLCASNTVTTGELQQKMQIYAALFGNRFALHLAHTLQQRSNQADQQAIVWLLTLLNDKATIPLLQHLSNQQQLPRATRLSASLALAGMGATQETTETKGQTHEYTLRYSG